MEIPANAETAFIICAFGMLGLIAAADGEVSKAEFGAIGRLIDSRLKFDKKRKELALEIFAEARSNPLEMRDYALKFKQALPDRIVLRDQVVQVLLELSVLDGKLSVREDSLIRSAALVLGLSDEAYQRMKRKVVQPEQEVQ
jgi:DnaJ like chaperone protein